jgi:hypothetical protein
MASLIDNMNRGISLADNYIWQPAQAGAKSFGEMAGSEGFANSMMGLSSLANAWNMWKQNKLMEEQMSQNLAFGNRNLANQAATTNQALRNQASMQAQMKGNAFGSTGYEDSLANATQVDGSPVGVPTATGRAKDKLLAQ